MAEKTNAFWIAEIERCISNHPDWSAERIEIELRRVERDLPEQVRLEVKAVPSLRVIQRERKRFKDQLNRDPSVVDRYKYFRWPESMEAGTVPWEESETCFELIRELEPELRDRVPAMLLRRFWQVTRSAPMMPRLDRLRLAVRWSIFEQIDIPEGIRWCEAVLIQRLWEQGASIEEPLRQIRQIEQAIGGRQDIEIPEQVLRALVEMAENDQPEIPFLWAMPPRLYVLAYVTGLGPIETSLWGREIAAEEKGLSETRERLSRKQREIDELRRETDELRREIAVLAEPLTQQRFEPAGQEQEVRPKGILFADSTRIEPGDKK